jgi:hypothetical protein
MARKSEGLFIIILDRGPEMLPRRLGYATAKLAWWKAGQLAYVHGLPQSAIDARGDANATVIYIDASPWYTRAHN